MSRRMRCRLEFAKGVLAACALVAMLPAPAASADVRGERVVRGDVTFHRQGNRLLIRASDGSIIEYGRFNIGRNELVRFIQPGEFSRVLNRIDGAAPTRIEGRLLANGQVYLVNPAGVMFGAGSVVNVGGLYAAAAQISNTNFLSGVNHFTDASGSVVNRGAMRGDDLHLLGRHVENYGNIRSDGGIVTMLAGDNMLIGEVGGRVLVQVDGRTLADGAAPSRGGTAPNLAATAGVRNEGTVSAGNGRIALGAGDLYALGIHNAGKLRAAGGRVDVSAQDGAVRNTGTISTSVVSGQAGIIDINGPSIVNQGRIAADARDGQAGNVRFTSQNHTFLTPGSVISASGGYGSASGGEVIIHSFEGLTIFDRGSLVDVSGGLLGGAGGFAEVSGMNLQFQGVARLGAAPGFEAGTLLIDPLDIRIVNGNENGDVFFGDGQILFNENGTGAGTTLRLRPQTLRNFAGNIVLQAVRDIRVEVDVDLSLNDNLVTMEAGRHVQFFDDIRISDATGLTIVADAPFAGFPSDGVGNVEFLGDADMTVLGAVNITGVNIIFEPDAFTASTSITLNGNVLFQGDAVQTMTASGGAITVTGNVTKTTTGDLTLSATTDVSVSGNIASSDGALSIASATATVGGDVAGADDVTIGGDLTLSGAGTQSLTSGGTLTTNGTVSKAAGDLVVSGVTGVDLNDAVTVDAGDFSSSGGTFDNTGAAIEAINIDIDHADGVTIAADLLADETLRVRAGNDGTGDLAIGAVTLEATDMLLQAGDGNGGGAASEVTFNAAAVFQGPTPGPGALETFLWQQDADILNSTGPNPAQFTGGLAGLPYTIISDDGSVTIDNLLKVAGTNLVLQAATDVDINVALNLASLDATAGNAINLNGGFLITSGDQRYRSPVVLGLTLPLQSTGGGNIIFDSTVSGALFDLTLNTTGITRFSDLSTVNLFVFSGGGGTIELDGATLQSAAIQIYNKPIVLLADSTIAGLGGANITFQQAITGDFLLNVNTAGISRFDGSIDIGSIETDAAGSTTFGTGSITTSGFQRWNDPVTLLANATFGSPSGNITFFETVTGGAFDLVVDTGGATRFDDHVTVRSLSTIGGGNTRFTGPLTVLTSTGQTFSDAVVLFGDTIFQDSASSTIEFGNGVTGLFVLDARTAGITRFVGTVTVGRIVTDAGGTTEINTANVTTNAGQEYGDDVVLGTNTTLADNGSSLIHLADSVTGAFNLTVNTAGVTRFADLVNIAAITTDAAGTTELNNGGVTTTGNQTFNDAVILGQNTVLTSTASGNVRLIGGATGAFDLTINTAGVSEIRGATSVNSILTDAAGSTQLRGAITTAAGQTYNDAVTLTANTTLNTTNSDIAFASTVGGAFDLTTNTGAGNVMFQDLVNGLDDVIINNTGVTTFAAAASMGSLSTDAGGTTAINGGSLTTTGSQIYGDTVTFGGATTLTASGLGGNVRFDQALNNATIDLIINATGETRFDGAVTLQSLTTNAAGTTRINGGSVTTTGTQTYNDQIVLGAATTLASTGAAGVLVRGGATGAFALNLNTTGATELVGPVSVASVTTDAGGTSELRGAIVTTGAQTYNDAVTLGANTTLTTTNSNVLFASTVGGAFNLTASAGSGDITFQDVVNGLGDVVLNSTGATTFGAASSMGTLVTNAGGATLINGGSVTTAGDQTYNDAVTLGANTTLTTGGGDLTINGALGGAFDLTVQAGAGDASFQGINGLNDLVVNSTGSTIFQAAASLNSLTTNVGGSTRVIGGSITTTGAQNYNDDVTLGADATLSTTNSNILFNQALSGTFDLTISNGSGSTTFQGAVSALGDLVINSTGVTRFQSAAAMNSLVTSAGGSTRINGGSIVTTGGQTYGDAVVLGSAATLTTFNGAILFANTVSGPFDLTATTGSGNVTFQGLVSGLDDVLINSTGFTTFAAAANAGSLTTNAGGVTRINGGSITTTGGQTYNDAVVLGTDTTLGTNGGALTFGNALSGAFNLTANTGGGNATFQGINGLVDLLINAGTGNVTFQGVMNGVNSVVVNSAGTTTIAAAVGNTGSLTTDAPGSTVISGATVTTTAGQTYGDAVTLAADTTLTTSNGNVLFGSTLGGAFDLTMNTGTGDVTFQGAVNGLLDLVINNVGTTTFASAAAMRSLATNAGGMTAINGGSITTNGGQAYGDQVVLGSDATLTTNGGDLTFANALSGAFDLTAEAGAGNASFLAIAGLNDLVVNSSGVTTFGGAANLASLRTNAGGSTRLNGGVITTTGSQAFNDAVTLGANTTLTTAGSAILFGNTLGGAFDLTANSGAGNVTFGGGINGLQDVSVLSTGVTTFASPASMNTLTTDAGGSTRLNGGAVATSGSQVYGDTVVLGANTTITTNNSAVQFGGGVSGAFNLTVNTGSGDQTYAGVTTQIVNLTANSSGATTFTDTATIGSLVTDAAGTTNLGGVLNLTNALSIGDAILVVGDSTLNYTGATPLIFGTTINDDAAPGGNALRINSSEDIFFQQAIGGVNPLGSFAVQTTGGPPFRTIFFNTNVVQTIGDLALQPDGHVSVPPGATIVAQNPSGITFRVLGNGDFIMGQNAKMVVADPTLGAGAIIDTATQSVLNILLDGTGTATLGDLSALGDINVTAQSIRIRLRDPAVLIAGPTLNDLTIELDFGTDFVTGGVFRFSTIPITVGDGRGGLFANPDGQGDVTGNLSGFIIQSFGINQNVTDAILLRLANGDVAFVDLRTDGPTITNYAQALASVIPRDEKAEAVDPESALDATEIELLTQLGVNARFLPLPDARQNAEEGVGRFNDRRDRLPEIPGVTANRLQTRAARGLLEQYRDLMSGGMTQADPSAFQESVREQLLNARMEFADQQGDEFQSSAFLTFLDQEPYADANRFIRGFRGIIAGIRTLGLTEFEIRRVQELLAGSVKPVNITVEEMANLLSEEAAHSEQPE